jgi:hypothetical protein
MAVHMAHCTRIPPPYTSQRRTARRDAKISNEKFVRFGIGPEDLGNPPAVLKEVAQIKPGTGLQTPPEDLLLHLPGHLDTILLPENFPLLGKQVLSPGELTLGRILPLLLRYPLEDQGPQIGLLGLKIAVLIGVNLKTEEEFPLRAIRFILKGTKILPGFIKQGIQEIQAQNSKITHRQPAFFYFIHP